MPSAAEDLSLIQVKPWLSLGILEVARRGLPDSWRQIANAGIVFEPLHIQHVREARRLGLKWQNLHLPDELWPEGQEYVWRVLSGKVLNGWTTSHIPLRRVFEIDRWVVKFVCANQMLGWIARDLQVPKPILLIRHPCAVLASRISRGWTLYRTLSNKDEFLRAYPEKAHCFGSCQGRCRMI